MLVSKLSFRSAFTLIELLIVVAIIAILAAIAVPNFLAAQTRAKVSRVRSDFRTIATAMEVYLVDFNSYVNDSDNTLGKGGQGGLALLTSPVAYMSTLATDVFQSQVSNNTAQDGAKFFELGSGSDNQGWTHSRFGTNDGFLASPPAPPKINSWLVMSVGPDFSDNITGNDEWPGGPGTSNVVMIVSYDATNGTISDGDLYRAGGSLGVGNYYVDGKRLGELRAE